MVSESELESMWDSLDGIDRQLVVDHVTMSAGLDIGDRGLDELSYDELCGHFGPHNGTYGITRLKNCIVWAAGGQNGELYVENDAGEYDFAFYPKQ